MTNFITRRNVFGAFIRKDVKCYKVKTPTGVQWFPVATTIVVDAKTSLSFLRSEIKFPEMEVGSNIILTEDDVIIYLDSGRICRVNVKKGSKLTLTYVSTHRNTCHTVGITYP